MDLAEYYEEVTKTAGLKKAETTETEVSDEKVAAVVAVSEQFDIDGIAFDSEDEKIAAAAAIVDGFEAASAGSDKTAGVKEKLMEMYGKAKGGVNKATAAAKEHLKKHKGKYIAGAGAGAAGGVAGYVAGRKSK